MDDRKKLFELIVEHDFPATAESLADHLIARGVTIRETVTPEKEPFKNEYWGYWGTCPACGSSNRWGVNFCCDCGVKFKKENDHG